MSSFWKKHLKHPDAEALIKIDLEKNDNETYNGTIRLTTVSYTHLAHEELCTRLHEQIP